MSTRSEHSAILLGVIMFLTAGPTLAQTWQGRADLEIRVSSRKGGNLSGARVELKFRDGRDGQGPAPVATDAKGRAIILGLAAGTWQVEVKHPNFMSFVAVVRLDSRAKPQVTASFLEASSGSSAPIQVKLLRAKGGSASLPLPVVAAASPPVPEPAPTPTPRPEPTTPPQAPVATPEPLQPAAPTEPKDTSAEMAPSVAEAEPVVPEVIPEVMPEVVPEVMPEPEPAPVQPEPAPRPREQPLAPTAPAMEPPGPTPTPVEETPTSAPEPEMTEEPKAAMPKPIPPEPVVEQPEPDPDPMPEPEPPQPETPAPEPAIEQVITPATKPQMPSAPPAEPTPAPISEPETEAETEVMPESDAPVAKIIEPEPAETTSMPMPEIEAAPPEPMPELLPELLPESTLDLALAPTPAQEASTATAYEPAWSSYRQRNCPRCRPGQWSVEVAATLQGAGSCSQESLDAAAAGLEQVGETDEVAAQISARLAAAGSNGCAVLAVTLPKGSRYVSFAYEHEGAAGRQSCTTGEPCGSGSATFIAPPHVTDGTAAMVIHGLASGDDGVALMTVFFRAPTDRWVPQP